MSLINKMLRDLDARHATAIPGNLPTEVRPSSRPRSDGAGQRPGTLLLGLALLVAAATGAWWLQSGALPFEPAPTPRPAPTPIAAGKPEAVVAAAPAVAMPEPPPEPPAAAVKPTAPKAAAAAPRDKKPSPAPEIQGDTGLRLAAAIAGNVPAEPVARRPATAAEPDTTPARIDKSPHLASARDRAEAEFRKGLDRVRQGRSADAAALFQAALREDATHVPARNGLLNALLENQRLAEAQEVLRQGIAQQPVHLPWVVSLARLRIEQADPAGAWEVLQAHVQAGTGSADFQGLAGVVLQRLARTKESIEHYQAAVRLAPDNPRWWVGLGVAMEAEGRADAAREAYRKAKDLPGLSPKLAAFVEQRLR